MTIEQMARRQELDEQARKAAKCGDHETAIARRQEALMIWRAAHDDPWANRNTTGKRWPITS
jgi:hypothetical protein